MRIMTKRKRWLYSSFILFTAMWENVKLVIEVTPSTWMTKVVLEWNIRGSEVPDIITALWCWFWEVMWKLIKETLGITIEDKNSEKMYGNIKWLVNNICVCIGEAMRENIFKSKE